MLEERIMNKVLLNAWVVLLKGAGTNYSAVLHFLFDRQCPVCESGTREFEPEQFLLVKFRCPVDANHGILESRKKSKDFFCQECRKSMWDWDESMNMRYCPHCSLPFQETALLTAAENNLPRFPEPIPALKEADVFPATGRREAINWVRAKLGL